VQSIKTPETLQYIITGIEFGGPVRYLPTYLHKILKPSTQPTKLWLKQPPGRGQSIRSLLTQQDMTRHIGEDPAESARDLAGCFHQKLVQITT